MQDYKVGEVVGRKLAGSRLFKLKYIGEVYCIAESVSTGEECVIKLKNLKKAQLKWKGAFAPFFAM